MEQTTHPATKVVARIKVRDGVEIPFVINRQGVVTFQSIIGTEDTISGVIMGVDTYGKALKIKSPSYPTATHIPLGLIVSIDQGLDLNSNAEVACGFFVRSGEPVDNVGEDNSIWFDTNSPNNVYFKQNGHWVFRCSLKGKQGIQGVPGETFTRSYVESLGLQIDYVYTSITKLVSDYQKALDASTKSYITKHRFGEIIAYVDPETLDINLFLWTPLTKLPESLDIEPIRLNNPCVNLIEVGLLYYGKLNENTGMLRGLPGRNGQTPYINPKNNHWFIGGNDLGVCAQGHTDTIRYDSSIKRLYYGETDITDTMSEFVKELLKED